MCCKWEVSLCLWAFIVLRYFSAGFLICNKFQDCRLQAQPLTNTMVIYLRTNTSVRILWLNTTVHSSVECEECRGCRSWGSRERRTAIRLPWTAEPLRSLPPVKNERNSLRLYFMPTRLAFPGMRTQQEWHLMITQHMHLTHQHLTCMKNATSDCQSCGAIL